jgi:hypothetical protein
VRLLAADQYANAITTETLTLASAPPAEAILVNWAPGRGLISNFNVDVLDNEDGRHGTMPQESL